MTHPLDIANKAFADYARAHAPKRRIPDDAQVMVITGLGDRRQMTLAEARAAHLKFEVSDGDYPLRTTGECRVLMLRIRLLSFKVDGWTITFDPPPIPVRNCDWHFAHDDFDASWEGEEDGYVSNGLAGSAESPEACLREIADIEAERA